MAHFRLTRRRPSPDLAGVVDRHWSVRWDLRGRESFDQQILPHPCVNLVWEPAGPAVYGVVEGRSVHHLESRGEALGVKFLPGAFSLFSVLPAVELTGRIVTFEEALGPEGAQLAREGEAAGSAAERIALAETFLRERRGDPDPRVETVVAAAEAMRSGPPDQRVSDVAGEHGLSVRTLQRLFRDHVGVSPKWVLQRYRMHDAAERIAAGEAPDTAELALELGYFDQAHFGNDFRRYVGIPPAAYAAACAGEAESMAA
jgi:AraC-like DNA-binding protein